MGQLSMWFCNSNFKVRIKESQNSEYQPMKYDYVFGYSKRIFTHSSRAGRVGNAFHVHLKMTVFSFFPPPLPHTYTPIHRYSLCIGSSIPSSAYLACWWPWSSVCFVLEHSSHTHHPSALHKQYSTCILLLSCVVASHDHYYSIF